MKCVVLAAGFGSRMQPFSSFRPKFMLPVAGKPIIQYGIEQIRDQLGITEFIFVVGYLRNSVIEYFNSGSDFGINIKYVIQHSHNKRGLAAAIKLVEEHVSSDFIVHLADNLFDTDFTDLVETHFKSQAEVSLLTEIHPNPSRYGVVVSDENGTVSQVIEKPDVPPSNQVITGFYVFSSSIFHAIDHISVSQRGEYDITSAIQHIVDNIGLVKSSFLTGWRQDIGYPRDLLTVNNRFLESQNNDPNTLLSFDTCRIIPPVYISPNCKLKNSTIGPYVMLENGVTIEDSKIYNSIVLEASTIVESTVTDSVIGAKSHLKNVEPSSMLIGDFTELTGLLPHNLD
ncbi:MAG: NTP transferase domain-containing protein [Candidatus Heimdallarchaeota archaeon]|nr:NTP transferase domain-containing protein [Candidatus Heimdallarchaeota archaeon]MCK5048668.1 NTP transferase domain-containing protein [Candidatus Heimdallarchaeota archaeon]